MVPMQPLVPGGIRIPPRLRSLVGPGIPVLASLTVAVMLGASCGSPTPSRPDIVLVVIDTLRPDHLPFYAYAQNTAPFLSTLAARGVVFERVHSTSSWTAPATASILTSLYPIQHGVHTGFVATQALQRIDPQITLDRIPAEVTTVAEMLKEAGYSTWAVSDNINVSRAQGFDQGFDHFHEFVDRGAQTVNAAVKEWAARLQREKPYFLYLHYMDPHRPYRQHPPWYRPGGSELLDSQSAYDSEIHYVDQCIAELSRLLRWDRPTLLLVTSDHGEEFLEHGGWDHGRTLYGEVLNVPLLAFWSGVERMASAAQTGASAPRRVLQRVSTLDILPTLREAAGLPPAPQIQGLSLLTVIRGQGLPPEGRELFAELRSAPWFGSRTLKAVIRGNDKYVLTLPDSEEFFDLAGDPREQRSLAGEPDARLAELRSHLERFEAECPRFAVDSVRATLDPQMIEKLKSLGYVK